MGSERIRVDGDSPSASTVFETATVEGVEPKMSETNQLNIIERVERLEAKVKKLEQNYAGIANAISEELGRVQETINEEFARMNAELAKRIEGYPVPEEWGRRGVASNMRELPPDD